MPKNERSQGLLTARRRAKLELMLEHEAARDALSKRLQAQQHARGVALGVTNGAHRVPVNPTF